MIPSRQRRLNHSHMANTYSQLFYHLVFSTKARLRLINREIESRVWSYIGGVARKHELTALQVGGIEHHIHALVMARPVVAPYQIQQWLKGDSSKWIHVEFPTMSKFNWQDGYGIFSVSKSQIPDVIKYIANQREHHANQTFEQEYISLLNLHEIDYDARYVFD